MSKLGYSYINFMPETFSYTPEGRRAIYYHELGHATAEVYGLLLPGGCLEGSHYGQPQPWDCQWNEGFAEFVSMIFTNRTWVYHESDQSPNWVALQMKSLLDRHGDGHFHCWLKPANTEVRLGLWTRQRWESLMRDCVPQTQPIDPYDRNSNGLIDDDEMLHVLDLWIRDNLSENTVLIILSRWISKR